MADFTITPEMYRGQRAIAAPGARAREIARGVARTITRRRQEPAPAPAAPQREDGFFRNIFINETGTGLTVSTRGRREGEEVRPEKVTFDENLRGQYATFLKNHVRRLLVLRNTPGVDINLVLQNHQEDRALLAELTSPKRGENGENDIALDDNDNPILDIDEAKIDKFLKSPRGWMITTQVLEYQASLEMYALALNYSANSRGERLEHPELRNIPLGIDQGILNRFITEHVAPFMQQRVMQVGGRPQGAPGFFQQHLRRSWLVGGETAAIGALAIAARFGGLNPALAGTLAVLPPVAYGAWHTMRPGVHINMDRCAATFQAIRGNAAEEAYMRSMAGIDVEDYDVNAQGNIIATPGRFAETNNIADLQKNILSKLYTRFEFYTSLGVPHDKLDALPEQFLYQFVDGRPEQTSARWQKRLQEIWQPNDPATGIVPGNITESLIHYNHARQQVIMEMMRDYVREEVSPGSSARNIGALRDASRERSLTNEVEGQVVQNARVALERERTSVQESMTGLNSNRESLQTYDNKLSELQRVRDNLDRILRTTLTNQYANPNTALTALRAALVLPGSNVTINGVTINSIADRTNTLEANFQQWNQNVAAQNPQQQEPPQVYARRVEPAYEANQRRHDRELTAITNDINTINSVIQRIESAQEEITRSQTELAENNRDVVGTRQVLNQLGVDYGAITSWSRGGVVLNQNALLNQPLEVIMARINEANRLDNRRGWPATENNRRDVRMRVVHAIAEARARQAEPALRAPSNDFITLTNPRTWNISENQLMTLTEQELQGILAERFARNPALGAIPAINFNQLVFETRNRFVARQNAIDQTATALQNEDNRLEGQITTIAQRADIREQRERFDTTADLMERQERVFAQANRVAFNQNNRFTNVAAVTNADAEYTQAERGAGLARGHYELLDVLFDYRRRPDREAYFQRIQRILPPNAFAQTLNDSLNLGLGAGATMDAVLTELQAGIAAGTIDGWNMRTAFSQIINRLYNEASATL